MATIDKAAIVWTIAIVAFGAGIATLGGSLQGSTPDTAPAPQPVPDQMDDTMMDDTMMDETMMDETMMDDTEKAAGQQTVTVLLPSGTSVPGCEETNACYIPTSVSINVGDTVSWDNADTAAHTITSGSAAGGPDGLFDSSLLLGGDTFEVTFDSAGNYDYYCLVHPWMVGDVQVS